MTATAHTATVRRVPPEATRPLRQRLLKQGSTLDDLARSDGGYPTAGYYAALDDQGQVLAVASARPEPPPWPHDAVRPWRIRGVVTDPSLRGQGLGTAVVLAVLDHIHRCGGDLAWLNGRTPARPFYEQLGFTQRSGEWDDRESGPHMTMARDLASDGGPSCHCHCCHSTAVDQRKCRVTVE